MNQTAPTPANSAQSGVPRLSATEAKSLHGEPGVVFLDVREPAEVAAGKVKGAVTIPRGALAGQADQLSKTDTIVVYCAAGGRAALAGETLKSLGFADVRNAGGFKDWVEAGGPVEV